MPRPLRPVRPLRGLCSHSVAVDLAVEPMDGQLAEPVRRRRQQYRAYQRRRRARQQATTFRLEDEVAALTQSIAALEHANLHLFSSRGTHEGAPASIVSVFFRVFEHGLVASQSARQDRFLRSMMASDVQGPDYRGVEALAEQWQLYAICFVWTRTVPLQMTVLTLNESTVVVVDVAASMLFNRSGVECLCPSIGDDESTTQQLLACPLDIYGSVRFEFDASGQVTWLGADMDFVSGLQRVLGSLSRVNACFQRSRISFMTGRISVDPSSSEEHLPRRDDRHNIDFLLS